MYKRAPLVYVTALVRTSALPKLTSDQTAILEQSLIEKGLIHTVLGYSHTIEFQFDLRKIKEDSDAISSKDIDRQEARRGFFSEDKRTCLIIEKNSIQWRTSNYKSYNDFRESFSDLIQLLVLCVASYGKTIVQEVVLNYSDVVVPLEGRQLDDYFTLDSHILPLSFFKNTPDFQQAGVLNVTRVKSPTEKISISLEQLPTTEGKPSKFIPNSMIEFENDFAMPIVIQEDWMKPVSSRSHYALLLTQASALVRFKLEEFLKADIFSEIHDLTSQTFKMLINKEVCDVDWQLVDDRAQ